MSDSIQKYPVLRVAQLDTSDLDKELLETVKQSINNEYFKYIQIGFVQKYHAEIFSAIKLIIWYNTYFKNGQTIAQRLFDWRYLKSTNSHAGIEQLKVFLHATIYCFDELIEHRLIDLLKLFYWLYSKIRRRLQRPVDKTTNDHDQETSDILKLNWLVKYGRLAIQMLSYFNLIVFLYEGKYLHLWERLIGLTPVYNRQQLMRSANLDQVAREQLWRSYFALFKLSENLLNFSYLFKRLDIKSYFRFAAKAQAHRPAEDDDARFLSGRICVFCEKAPINVHSCNLNSGADNCKHVFCYLCVIEQIKKLQPRAQKILKCPKCFKLIQKIQVFYKNNNTDLHDDS